MNITTITLNEPKYSIVLTLNKIIINVSAKGTFGEMN